MSRTLAIVVAIVLAGLLLAGCGDSERLTYERDLTKVGRDVERALDALPQDDTRTIGPGELSKLASQLREAADQLDDLDPPKGVGDAQRRLGHGLRGVATGFDDLASNLRAATDDQARSELFIEFQADEHVDAAFEDILAAQAAYSAKGYRVFETKAPVATARPKAKAKAKTAAATA
ncbi:MAG: hypothetical protein JWM98_2448 [Thermoleophilia bacterium]|nr:hypothetical protein [Thermoleophilia bacterium]